MSSSPRILSVNLPASVARTVLSSPASAMFAGDWYWQTSTVQFVGTKIGSPGFAASPETTYAGASSGQEISYQSCSNGHSTFIWSGSFQ
jgi:hypothetical protein